MSSTVELDTILDQQNLLEQHGMMRRVGAAIVSARAALQLQRQTSSGLKAAKQEAARVYEAVGAALAAGDEAALQELCTPSCFEQLKDSLRTRSQHEHHHWDVVELAASPKAIRISSESDGGRLFAQLTCRIDARVVWEVVRDSSRGGEHVRRIGSKGDPHVVAHHWVLERCIGEPICEGVAEASSMWRLKARLQPMAGGAPQPEWLGRDSQLASSAAMAVATLASLTSLPAACVGRSSELATSAKSEVQSLVARAEQWKRRLAARRRPKGPAWKVTRTMVLERDHHRCAYCRSSAMTVDHIVPRAEGGGDSLSNLVACCGSCNAKKADKLLGILDTSHTTSMKPRYTPLFSSVEPARLGLWGTCQHVGGRTLLGRGLVRIRLGGIYLIGGAVAVMGASVMGNPMPAMLVIV